MRNTIDEDLNILTSRGTKYFYQFVIRVPFAFGERLKSFWIPFSKIQLILVHYGIREVHHDCGMDWIELSYPLFHPGSMESLGSRIDCTMDGSNCCPIIGRPLL